MKKLALVLCLALILNAMCLFVSADGYGADTQKLLITHINEHYAPYEGTGIIYSSSNDGTIAPYGSFDWWYVAAFEWSETETCYTVVSISTAMGSPKGDTKIPENGFVYCCNTGNDYPALGDNTKPNYTTSKMNDTCAYIASIKVGDKAYIYGTDLLNATVDTNDAVWYTDEFESNAFIKIGSKESGLTEYNPSNATVKIPEKKLGINSINTGIKEGQAMLLTPSYGATVTAKGNNYGWCRVAVFDWSNEDGAYVLISSNTSVGNGVQKNALIPPNGFAVSVNLGNNYPALGDNTKPNYVNKTATNTYDALGALAIGTKVYLEGIDLANNSFEYEGDINKYYSSEFVTKGFITVSQDKPEGCYEPDTSKILDTPEISNEEEMFTVADIKLEWSEVEGASKYYVAVFNSTINTNGDVLISKEVNDTSVTIPSDDLTVGSVYTVNVYAISENGSSQIAEYSFTVCSERALNSIFRDKKIVAFGDSLTAWKGWVSMLYGELGTEVINSGVGGDRTVQALARIEKDVIVHNPDLVIINFGLNDQAVDASTGKNLTPIDQYENNYRSIIEQILEIGSDIILVAPHDICDAKYGGGAPVYNETNDDGVGYVDVYNEVVKKLAEEYNLGFLDINTLAENQLEDIILDGIHLNDLGQQRYCKWISDYCFEYMETKAETDNSSENESANESQSGEVSDESRTDNNAVGNMTTTQIAIAAAIMFAVIAVVGVMFAKIVMKNKKDRR